MRNFVYISALVLTLFGFIALYRYATCPDRKMEGAHDQLLMIFGASLMAFVNILFFEAFGWI